MTKVALGRFNKVPRDWGNWFVILRVRYIENLAGYNQFAEKTTKMFVISRYSQLIIIVFNAVNNKEVMALIRDKEDKARLWMCR